MGVVTASNLQALAGPVAIGGRPGVAAGASGPLRGTDSRAVRTLAATACTATLALPVDTVPLTTNGSIRAVDSGVTTVM